MQDEIVRIKCGLNPQQLAATLSLTHEIDDSQPFQTERLLLLSPRICSADALRRR
jgi:hypothetical protein